MNKENRDEINKAIDNCPYRTNKNNLFSSKCIKFDNHLCTNIIRDKLCKVIKNKK